MSDVIWQSENIYPFMTNISSLFNGRFPTEAVVIALPIHFLRDVPVDNTMYTKSYCFFALNLESESGVKFSSFFIIRTFINATPCSRVRKSRVG